MKIKECEKKYKSKKFIGVDKKYIIQKNETKQTQQKQNQKPAPTLEGPEVLTASSPESPSEHHT